jgi:hypothetical protein
MTQEEPDDIKAYSGHRYWSLDEIAMVQPGLARIMPEIGRRAGILIHAARASNWELAHFQLKEIRELMELGAMTRPKYQFDLEEFNEKNLAALEKAILANDLPTIEDEFAVAVKQANAYHEKHNKKFLVWKTPESPPPDMDLTPR